MTSTTPTGDPRLDGPSAFTGPRNVIVVLLDSLRRSVLGPYGSSEVATPNLDRLAMKASRLTRHYAGSLPCMPARHDLATGTHDFLWKPWGSLECWEQALPTQLRNAGVMTQLVTDHYHLFSVGGENYHHDFVGWEFLRGHEADLWATEPVDTSIGTPTLHARDFIYPRNKVRFLGEEDYPGPKTMAAAAAWLDRNVGRHERFFMLVDEFDPHEPFDTPPSYKAMYDDPWTGPELIWPPYAVERLDAAQAAHLRAQYSAKVTMIDHWFGKLLDSFDRNNVWDDTVVIVTTDHGLYLGDNDYWGKPSAPVRQTLALIPAFVHVPGNAPRQVDALTSTVDVHATVLDVFGLEPDARAVGRSMLPLITGGTSSIRDYAFGGYFARTPFVTDGSITYQPAQRADAQAFMYSNRWSGPAFMQIPNPDERAELGAWMPGVDVPMIRQPIPQQPYPQHGMEQAWLYDVGEDPGQSRNLAAEPRLERRAAELLVTALEESGAPREVYERAGLP
ncbi:MAG: betC [Frankiales bacterium]|nr:betC [Frankiales bacterium]